MFCVGFNTKPHFRARMDYGPRGHQVLEVKASLPLHIGAELYVSTTGAQVTLDIGSLGITPFVFWPLRRCHDHRRIGMHLRLGNTWRVLRWPKLAS